jgi:MFS family permease
VFFTLIVPIEVVYAEETLQTDEAGYGILLSSWGAGVVLGSVVFLAVRRRSAFLLIMLSTLAIGAAYLGMSVARELWVACAFSVVGGLGNGVQWVSVMTALQEATPQDLQARVTGVLESVASAMTGVGFLLGGVITALTAPPTAFAVSGLGVVVVVAFMAVAWRGMQPARAGAEAARSPAVES